MKKPILAALLGGLVVFVWGTISHMVLPLGQAGVTVIRPESEAVVLATMKAAMPERALYIFPGMKQSGATDEDRRLWQEKHKAGPATSGPGSAWSTPATRWPRSWWRS